MYRVWIVSEKRTNLTRITGSVAADKEGLLAATRKGSVRDWPPTIAIVTSLTKRAKENYIDSFKDKLAEAEKELANVLELTAKVKTKTKHVLQSMPATYVQHQKHSFAVADGTDIVQGLGTALKIPPYLRHEGPIQLKLL